MAVEKQHISCAKMQNLLVGQQVFLAGSIKQSSNEEKLKWVRLVGRGIDMEAQRMYRIKKRDPSACLLSVSVKHKRNEEERKWVRLVEGEMALKTQYWRSRRDGAKMKKKKKTDKNKKDKTNYRYKEKNKNINENKDKNKRKWEEKR